LPLKAQTDPGSNNPLCAHLHAVTVRAAPPAPLETRQKYSLISTYRLSDFPNVTHTNEPPQTVMRVVRGGERVVLAAWGQDGTFCFVQGIQHKKKRTEKLSATFIKKIVKNSSNVRQSNLASKR